MSPLASQSLGIAFASRLREDATDGQALRRPRRRGLRRAPRPALQFPFFPNARVFFKSGMEKRRLGEDKEKKKSKWFRPHSSISLCAVTKQDNPRHSPRAFPLGLLAPRYWVCRFSSHSPPLRDGCSGGTLFGGRKESSPQRLLASCVLVLPSSPTPR